MKVNAEKVVAYLSERIKSLEVENAVLKAQIDEFNEKNCMNYDKIPLQNEENVV